MTALCETPVALDPDAAPFVIRAERASDVVAREALLDACFGENHHMRTCQRLRDRRAPAEGLALSAVRQGRQDRLVGTLRLWHVSAGGVAALVLGPLAVDPDCRDLGIGAGLAWVEIFKTTDFEGYSGMLVFFTFMPLGAIIGGLGGALLFGVMAVRDNEIAIEREPARHDR